MRKAFVISGYFTDDDWIEMANTLRRIEQRHPEELYTMTGIDPSKTIEETERLMREHFPAAPGVPYDMITVKQVTGANN